MLAYKNKRKKLYLGKNLFNLNRKPRNPILTYDKLSGYGTLGGSHMNTLSTSEPVLPTMESCAKSSSSWKISQKRL